MSHTPGPWKAYVGGGFSIIAADKITHVCWRACPFDNIDMRQVESDAALISAAPDLLEAAEATIESDPCSDCGGLTMSDSASCETCWVTKLKAAIKKAV